MFEGQESQALPDGARIEFGADLSEADLRYLAGQRGLTTLQCSVPVPDALWFLLDDMLFRLRPDVQLRIYGHYGTVCDLSFAGCLKHVRRFAADRLLRARNVEAIGDIPQLEDLTVDISDLVDFAVLSRVSSGLKTLALGATTSKKPRLEPLARFTSLESLYLEGQSHGIEALTTLRSLRELTLRSISTPDLKFLAPLERLWSLDIKLGAVRSFEGVSAKPGIKYLEMWQVRGIQDAEVVASLPGLQNLFLQSLPHVKALPRLDRNAALRRVVLQNLKGLADFTAFETAPALEQFALVEGFHQQPAQLIPVLRNRMVRGARAHFGSHRRNDEFDRLRREYGKEEWSPATPFVYR